MKRRFRCISLSLLLMVIAGLVAGPLQFSPPVALAHANLARSEPAANSTLDRPPDRVVIWFTEPIEPGFSQIQVLDFRGQRVDNGDSVVDSADPTVMAVTLSDLPNGTYTVAWKNLSTVDGHTVRSAFAFSVGEPLSATAVSARPEDLPLVQSPLDPVFRWLELIGALTIVGGLALDLLITRPVLRRGGATQNLRHLESLLASRTARLIWAAAALFLTASVARLILQSAAVHEIPWYSALGSPLGSILTDTGWGHLWLWRIGLLLAVAAVLGAGSIPGLLVSARGAGNVQAGSAGGERTAAGSTQFAQILALAAGAGMLLTLSLVSHGAAAVGIRAAAIVSDYLHLLAAAFWVGGLFHLALAVPLVMKTLSPAERRRTLAAVVPRFSTVAALSVGVLIITGFFSAWVQVTILAAALTPYGLVLLTKLGLVAPLLALGAVNLVWVRPRLRNGDQGSRWLRRLAAGEAALAALVLLAVGMLGSMEPARQAASRLGIGQEDRLAFRDTVEGADIALRIEPGQVGPNRLLVTLKDRFGNPITNATEVAVGLEYLDADLGQKDAAAAPLGGGEYILENELLSVAGAWQVELVARRPDAFDARTAFRFEVNAPGTGGNRQISPSPATGKLLWGIELALIGVLFLSAGIPLGGFWSRRGALTMGTGLAAFLAGTFLALNTQTAGPGDAGVLRNPFPPTPESLAIGRQVYQGNCQSCHGTAGRGDGPDAAGLRPPPADLVVHVPLHFERDLFRFVAEGIPGTAMPPLGGKLTNEEIWHLINYIQTLEEQAGGAE